MCERMVMNTLTPGMMDVVKEGFGIISHPALHPTAHCTWDASCMLLGPVWWWSIFTPTSAPTILPLLQSSLVILASCLSLNTCIAISSQLLPLWRIFSPLISSHGFSFQNGPFSLIFPTKTSARKAFSLVILLPIVHSLWLHFVLSLCNSSSYLKLSDFHNYSLPSPSACRRQAAGTASLSCSQSHPSA